MSQKIKNIKISELQLWTENPRHPLNGDYTNEEIIKFALSDEDGKYKFQGLIDNFGEYFDFSEIPLVVEEEGENIIYDGNRRVIFIMALKDPELRKFLFEKYSVETDFSKLEKLEKIPCNVCDKKTAITSVYRKHAFTGSWSPLERDYFVHNHMKGPKSLTIYLNEQVGLIDADAKMNQRFVKEEVLTKMNLEEIGLKFEDKRGFTSNYSKKDADLIMNTLVKVIREKKISTRGKNRGKLMLAIKENYPKIANKIKSFNSKKKHTLLTKTTFEGVKSKPKVVTKKRKGRRKRGADKLFGRDLFLKTGVVNNSYMALDSIYETFKDDETSHVFLGASLRILLEIAARVHFNTIDHPKKEADQILDPFIKMAKKEVELPKKSYTYISIVKGWLNGDGSNYQAILHKFAHGNIASGKTEILEVSYVVGEILEHYFKQED